MAKKSKAKKNIVIDEAAEDITNLMICYDAAKAIGDTEMVKDIESKHMDIINSFKKKKNRKK